MQHDAIAVIDFGGQYAHLIATKVRRHGVLSEIRQPEDPIEQFERYKGEHPELVEFFPGFRPGASEVELPEHAVVEGDVLDDELEQLDEEPAISFQPGMTMAELEKEAIIATLHEVGGNRRKAAERLQIGERTLYRKLKEYDIEL